MRARLAALREAYAAAKKRGTAQGEVGTTGGGRHMLQRRPAPTPTYVAFTHIELELVA